MWRKSSYLTYKICDTTVGDAFYVCREEVYKRKIRYLSSSSNPTYPTIPWIETHISNCPTFNFFKKANLHFAPPTDTIYHLHTGKCFWNIHVIQGTPGDFRDYDLAICGFVLISIASEKNVWRLMGLMGLSALCFTSDYVEEKRESQG